MIDDTNARVQRVMAHLRNEFVSIWDVPGMVNMISAADHESGIANGGWIREGCLQALLFEAIAPQVEETLRRILSTTQQPLDSGTKRKR